MKKIYLLLLMLIGFNSFGQGTPIITMIADGDCSGGTPKVVEIYAKGTVDFNNYALENQTNSSSTWGHNFSLANLGTVTDNFVYVYYEGNNTGVFATEFPNASANYTTLDATSSSVLSINGDDRIRIVDAGGVPVDMYGEDGVDGTGTAWEYKDGYSKRNDGTGPDPVFIEANWTYNNGALNNQGACQGGSTFESIIGIATYQPATTATPSLAITSPTPNQVYNPETTDVTVEFVVQNFNVAQSGGDGHIHWKLDNGSINMKYDTNPIQLTGLSAGTHTVDMELVDNSHNSLNPPVTASVTFEIATYTQVADLATLRSSTLNEYYEVTGEVFITGGKLNTSGSATVFGQDATAGIMAYVPASLGLTNLPARGDGFTSLKGKLKEYHGAKELEITAVPMPTGNNVVQTPQIIAIADYLNNMDNYESELIKFENVTIDGNGDTAFQLNTNYTVTDGTDNIVLRTMFPDIENVSIPANTVNLTGIAGRYNSTAQIYPRDANDIETASNVVSENEIEGLKVYPNPVSDHKLYVNTPNNVDKLIVIYDIAGKKVLETIAQNNSAISVESLHSGVYLVKISENGKTTLRKLMIK